MLDGEEYENGPEMTPLPAGWTAEYLFMYTVSDPVEDGTPLTLAEAIPVGMEAAGWAAAVNRYADETYDAYYYKAVLWAVGQGITYGTGETSFSPDRTVSRGEAVTFLARMNGVQDNASGYTHNFEDVRADAYYNNAVAWAYADKITVGTGAAAFSPDDDCLRSQIVCFLYRCSAIS